MIKLNMNLPPDIARRFVEDMEAFYAEPNAIKQDEIAARQLHILREHRKPRDPKLRSWEWPLVAQSGRSPKRPCPKSARGLNRSRGRALRRAAVPIRG